MKVHFEAVLTVNRDNGIKYYRCCGIPGSDKMLRVQIQHVEYVQYWIQCNQIVNN